MRHVVCSVPRHSPRSFSYLLCLDSFDLRVLIMASDDMDTSTVEPVEVINEEYEQAKVLLASSPRQAVPKLRNVIFQGRFPQ